MTEYHIKTEAGKEGPFSAEELRKKKITSSTIVSQNGAAWKAAGKIPALRSILPEIGDPIFASGPEGKHAAPAEADTGQRAKSKYSILQLTAFILLLMNVVLYYYKQGEADGAETKTEIAVAPPAEKAIKVEKAAVQPAIQAAAIQQTDTISAIRDNWAEFIKARHNDFKHYTKLGGIHQLKAIVSNDTSFPLDTVRLAVNYIRRGETFKTEYVTLVNIPEHGELAVPAPNSRSGTEVTLHIREISSQKMQLHYKLAN